MNSKHHQSEAQMDASECGDQFLSHKVFCFTDTRLCTKGSDHWSKKMRVELAGTFCVSTCESCLVPLVR